MTRALKLVGLIWIGLILILGSFAAAHAATSGRQQLHGHVPKEVLNGAVDNGRYDRSKKLWLAIQLPWRNPDQLQTLIQNLYDPSSPLYHQYLTTQQFVDAYAPTEQDYQSVIAFAKSKGLRVANTHGNRLLVDVEGAVPDIEAAFNVEIHSYTKPDGTTFYAPDREPSLDLDTPISRIGGLDNANPPHPLYFKRPANYVSHKVVLRNPQGMAITEEAGYGNGTGTANCAGCYVGNDLRDAYLPGVTLQGQGQVSSIIAVDGYYASDIATYMSKVGLPNNVPLVNVLVDGFDGNVHGSGGNGENSLDIEQQLSLDQGLSQLRVYEGSANIDDDINECAVENIAKTCSASYGWGPDTTLSSIGQEFAAQGQSLFIASGDGGAYVGGESGDAASENPYITVVGGTDLYTTGPGGAWSSETAWVDGGGGIGLDYAIPGYQSIVNMGSNGGSTTNRNVPDVAMNANFTYMIITYDPSNGSDEADYIGGTSASTPLWAAFTALVNQQAASAGKPSVGFINPAIYNIGTGSGYTTAFHDIVSGNNNNSGNGGFNAVTGYDLATGWGSPNGQGALNAMSNAAGAPTATNTATPTPVIASTWRVRAGTGSSYTDCQNNVWSPDEDFVGGGENSSSNSISNALPCSTDGALYQTERYGNFYYVFHVPNGSYQVTLKFAELFDSGSGTRVENVSINGQTVLSNFDIFATAGGQNIAVDKVFSGIAPANGAITISVAPTSGSPDQNAKIDAIQIVQVASTPTPTPCAPTAITPYLEVNGGAWQQASAVTVLSGNTVNLGPQPTTGGSWSWTGPNSFTSTAREIDNIALSAGTNTYTAAYTNACGAQSTQAFTIVVLVPTSTPTNSPTVTSTATPVVKSTWRIAGGKTASYTDCQSNIWSPDSNYNTGNFNGNSNTITKALPCTTDQSLYQTEHWAAGGFTYTFNVPAGTYQVTLKFAEIFDNAAGDRIQNISINGTQVLTNFDIYATAGGMNIATDQVFNNISPVNGTITIAFAPTSGSPDQNAKVDALQIVPQPATPTNTSTSTATQPNTATPSMTATATSTLTNTSTAVNTSTSTVTPTWTGTATWTASSTPVLTGSVTPPPTLTNTSTAVNTSTSTVTSTLTSSATRTATPIPPTGTNTPTLTNTNSPVPPTATWTFSSTPTKTATPVPPTATSTWTFTAVPPTATPSFTPTKVPPTATPTSVPPTATPTTASICSGIPAWNGNFVYYSAGTKVTYNNELYQCWQSHTSEPNWMPPAVPALWQDLGSCSGAPAPAVASSGPVIKSAVAGPNVSRNFQPVRFYIQLNQPGEVMVDIFTPLGQRVTGTTFYGNTGMNDWLWDVQNATKHMVSSGLYIYTIRVTVNGATEMKTGKVVILH